MSIIDSILFIVYILCLIFIIRHFKFIISMVTKRINIYGSVVAVISESDKYRIRDGINLHDGINKYFEFIHDAFDNIIPYISPYILYLDADKRLMKLNSSYREEKDVPICKELNIYTNTTLSEVIPVDVGEMTNHRIMSFSIFEFLKESGSLEDRYAKFLGLMYRWMKLPLLCINNHNKTIKLYAQTADNEKICGALIADSDTFDELKEVIYKSSILR